MEDRNWLAHLPRRRVQCVRVSPLTPCTRRSVKCSVPPAGRSPRGPGCRAAPPGERLGLSLGLPAHRGGQRRKLGASLVTGALRLVADLLHRVGVAFGVTAVAARVLGHRPQRVLVGRCAHAVCLAGVELIERDGTTGNPASLTNARSWIWPQTTLSTYALHRYAGDKSERHDACCLSRSTSCGCWQEPSG
jgi:hypothetical protein